jgi:hypothetical protein
MFQSKERRGVYWPVTSIVNARHLHRVRVLGASLSQFWEVPIAGPIGRAAPFWFIANDRKLAAHPVPLMQLEAGHWRALRHRRRSVRHRW